MVTTIMLGFDRHRLGYNAVGKVIIKLSLPIKACGNSCRRRQRLDSPACSRTLRMYQGSCKITKYPFIYIFRSTLSPFGTLHNPPKHFTTQSAPNEIQIPNVHHGIYMSISLATEFPLVLSICPAASPSLPGFPTSPSSALLIYVGKRELQTFFGPYAD